MKEFISSDWSEDEKVFRLYLEVRYAGDTSLSLPKNSKIFRSKRAHKNLDAKLYGDNVITFLDKNTFCNSVAMADFDPVLD